MMEWRTMERRIVEKKEQMERREWTESNQVLERDQPQRLADLPFLRQRTRCCPGTSAEWPMAALGTLGGVV